MVAAAAAAGAGSQGSKGNAAAAADGHVKALDGKVTTVLQRVDAIAKKQQGYEQQAKELVKQQEEILTLLRAMGGKQAK